MASRRFVPAAPRAAGVSLHLRGAAREGAKRRTRLSRQTRTAIGGGTNWKPGLHNLGSHKGSPIRENWARGREWMLEEQEVDRPQFDFMGKLMEWGQQKDTRRNQRYFYLDYLIDLEGYPEEMREQVKVQPEEDMFLRLLSANEERRFWKCFHFFQEQYEFENKMPVEPTHIAKTDVLEYCLRHSGLGSPAVFATLQEVGLDDFVVLALGRGLPFDGVKLTDDLRALFSGSMLVHVMEELELPDSGIALFAQHAESLMRFHVEVQDRVRDTVSTHVVRFRDAPHLKDIARAVGLEGGLDEWFVDVQGFYSTPGHMIFDDYGYHNFLLDWFHSMGFKHDGLSTSCKLVLTPRPTPEQVKESSRGWFHVV
eukprot:TRINITY_DN32939_c0_g1_i1.p1 TRINITY_DN32939_c0_g1~~TRINITY_DN32939_c0_g1_i1.p1  ORF type:complete len:384 (+),score=59.26 TRINITY_DN32939_c0_g1_i1:51-1154(+)